jgi:hypothetical protein
MHIYGMAPNLAVEERKRPDALVLAGEIKTLEDTKEIERRITEFKESGGDVRLLGFYIDCDVYHTQHFLGLNKKAISLERKLLAAKEICEKIEKPRILK